MLDSGPETGFHLEVTEQIIPDKEVVGESILSEVKVPNGNSKPCVT